MKAFASAALLLLITAATAWGQPSTLVSLFDFGTSVRATGMGGAFAGLADDEQALIYNPAGLALLDQWYAHATIQSHLSQSSLSALMGALPSLGAGLQFFGVGGLVQRDEQDEEGAPLNYGQFSLLTAGAVRLGSFIGLPALKSLGLGLRFKFLSVNTLAEGSGATFALDPSILWELGKLSLGPVSVQSLRLGATMDNLGPGITYGDGTQESLGLGARLGASVVIQDVTTVGLELNTADGLHAGAEYRLPVPKVGTLALRTGFHTGNGFTFTLGLGFRYQWVRIDYAFASHSQLGGSHQLAVAAAFQLGKLF